MTILGLAELFKTMNRLSLNRPWRSLTAYFSKSLKDRDVKFWHNIYMDLQLFKLIRPPCIVFFREKKTKQNKMKSAYNILK